MSEETNSPEGSEPSALEAAQKYFAAGDATPPPASSTPPPASTTPPPASNTPSAPPPSPLSAVLKGKETPPPTPPPASPAPIEEIDKGLQAPPDNAKSRAGWDELKKRAQAVVAEKAELAKKIADMEAKMKASPAAADEATLARLKQLEQENAQFSSRLKVLDTRNHPEFVSKYVAPANEAKQALAQIAKTEEVEVNVDEMLSLKGKALNAGISDAMEKMTPYARVQFQAAVDAYFKATVAGDAALQQADEFLKNAKQSTSARSREVYDKVAAGYTGVFLPATIDEKAPDAVKQADAGYNAALTKVSQRAEALAFGQIDEAGVADLSHKAALYEFTMTEALPRIERVYGAILGAKDSRIAELEAQVKSLTAVQPNVSGGAGASGDAPPAGDESHLSAASRYFKT